MKGINILNLLHSVRVVDYGHTAAKILTRVSGEEMEQGRAPVTKQSPTKFSGISLLFCTFAT